MSHRVVAIVIAGFFTVFAAFAIRYSYGLLLPEMIESLAISKTEAGIIYSSYFITATLLSPVLGLLGDRSDAKILLAIFVALLGIGTFFMSFSTTVIQASIVFAIAGIGHSACWAPVVTVVMRWASAKRRGIFLSMVDLGSTAGIAVCSIMIPLIVGAYSWRTVWMALGVLALVVAAMDFFMVKSHPDVELEHRGSPAPPSAPMPVRVAYKAIVRDKNFYLIGFSYAFISFSILIPLTFLITYATQELMIPYQSAAGLLAVFAVAGALGKLVLGHISDIVGRIRVMMLCGVLAATGSLGLAYSQEFLLLVLFSAVFGVGYGTIWPVYAASARDLFPKEYAGSVIGLWTLYHGLGSVIAPVIAGLTIDATGVYVWAFILAMISAIISFFLLWPMVKTV